MLKLNLQLLRERGFEGVNECVDSLSADKRKFIEELIEANGRLPLHPPVELHPYKPLLKLQSFEKYIIGTFPPISYILDEPEITGANVQLLSQPGGIKGGKIVAPWLPFYHGNLGSMWEYLLKKEERRQLSEVISEREGREKGRAYIIKKLSELTINYADIVDSTQRKKDCKGKFTANDALLYNICINKDLIFHVLANPNAKYLLFNTASIFTNGGLKLTADGTISLTPSTTRSFDLFIRALQDEGLEISIQIRQGNPATHFNQTLIAQLLLAQKGRKVALELTIKNPLNNTREVSKHLEQGAEKTLAVITPFSPAAVNRGKLLKNAVVANYLHARPTQTPADLIANIYQSFRQGNWQHLFNYNL